MSTARQYELVYIVAPDATEQDLADLQAQVEGVVTRLQGTIDAVDAWGRRRLAYEIAHHKEGIYTVVLFTGGPDVVKELDRRLKVIDRVLRHLIVRVDKEEAIAARRRAARQDEGARRRGAHATAPAAAVAEAPEGAPAEPAGGDVIEDTAEGPAAPAEA